MHKIFLERHSSESLPPGQAAEWQVHTDRKETCFLLCLHVYTVKSIVCFYIYTKHKMQYSIFLFFSCFTIKWPLVYSQSCAAITTIQFQNISNFLTSQRKPPTHEQSLPIPSPLSVSRFDHSRHFMWMKSCNMWLFVSGSFHLACC